MLHCRTRDNHYLTSSFPEVAIPYRIYRAWNQPRHTWKNCSMTHGHCRRLNKTYILCTNSEFSSVTKEAREKVAKAGKDNWTYREIPASHVPMADMPDAIVTDPVWTLRKNNRLLHGYRALHGRVNRAVIGTYRLGERECARHRSRRDRTRTMPGSGVGYDGMRGPIVIHPRDRCTCLHRESRRLEREILDRDGISSGDAGVPHGATGAWKKNSRSSTGKDHKDNTCCAEFPARIRGHNPLKG